MKKSIIDESFDIEPDGINNIIEYNSDSNVPAVSENISHPEYDSKDTEIESQFQEIYDKALDAFDVQVEDTSDIEGKYMARNAEVANQLLTTALAAAKEKSNLKKHSDHLKIKRPTSDSNSGSTTNIQNNNIIMDRNELLKIMSQKD